MSLVFSEVQGLRLKPNRRVAADPGAARRHATDQEPERRSGILLRDPGRRSSSETNSQAPT
jgi:hypothetical protein